MRFFFFFFVLLISLSGCRKRSPEGISDGTVILRVSVDGKGGGLLQLEQDGTSRAFPLLIREDVTTIVERIQTSAAAPVPTERTVTSTLNAGRPELEFGGEPAGAFIHLHERGGGAGTVFRLTDQTMPAVVKALEAAKPSLREKF